MCKGWASSPLSVPTVIYYWKLLEIKISEGLENQ